MLTSISRAVTSNSSLLQASQGALRATKQFFSSGQLSSTPVKLVQSEQYKKLISNLQNQRVQTPIVGVFANFSKMEAKVANVAMATPPSVNSLDHLRATYNRAELATAINKAIAQQFAVNNEDFAKWINDHPSAPTIDHWAIWGLPGKVADVEKLLQTLGYNELNQKKYLKDAQQATSWAHADLPEEMPLFSVSQWDHRLSTASPSTVEKANALAQRSVFPYQEALDALAQKLDKDGFLNNQDAAQFVRLASARFGNWVPAIKKADFDQMHAEGCGSLGWKATNGQLPNHVAVRVPNLENALQNEIKPVYPHARGDNKQAGPGLRHTPLGALQKEYVFEGNEQSLVKGSFLGFVERGLDENGKFTLQA